MKKKYLEREPPTPPPSPITCPYLNLIKGLAAPLHQSFVSFFHGFPKLGDWSKTKLCVPKNVGPKIFCAPKNFWSKKFWIQTNFESKRFVSAKNFCQKKNWVQKIWGKQNFGTKKNLGLKHFGSDFFEKCPPPGIKFRQEDIMTEAYRIVIIMSKQFPIFFLHLYCLIAVNILSFQIRPNKTKYQITVSQPINYEQIDNSNYSMPICAHLWLKLARSTMFMWIYRKLTIQSKSVGLGVDFVFSL